MLLSALLVRAALAGLWVAPIVTIIACYGLMRKLHSRATVGLLVGAVGGLLASLGTAATSVWFQVRLLELTLSVEAAEAGPQLQRTQQLITLPLSILALAFALTFSISLLLVMRDLPAGLSTAVASGAEQSPV